jgi:L-lysine epsilon oxidase C-terminal domain
MLTRAALEFCLADAFHPGCEMTWPVRTPSMFMEPYRFGHAPVGWVEPNLGTTLTSANVAVINGPLYRQVPGGISRWMAVPWQTDTASCQSGYVKSYDPNLPTFWPARVPNQVMTREKYAVVMNPKASREDRLAAFAMRSSWLDPLGTGSYVEQINNMIKGFDHMGVVEVNPGPADAEGKALFPSVIQVEDQHLPIQSTNEMVTSLAAHGGDPGARPDLSGIEKVHRFRHGLRR